MFTAMVTMGGWKLCFVLLLPTTVSLGSQVTLVKTVGSKPDVTPLCSNDTQTLITRIVCKIRTQRNMGHECHLLYHYGLDFEHGCDSRFTLIQENQTVFLHLTNLTAADSGAYTCQCSSPRGTDTLHLSVIAEEEEVSSFTKNYILISSIGASILITVTGVLLGYIHKRKRHGIKEGPGLSGHETPGSLDENDPDDPYMSLQNPENDLYQTISSDHRQHDTKRDSVNSRGIHLDNEDSTSDIYENI